MANPDPCRGHARAPCRKRPSRLDRDCGRRRRVAVCAGRCRDAHLSALLAEAGAGAAAGRIGCGGCVRPERRRNRAGLCLPFRRDRCTPTRVAAWLSRIGCSERDLACGPHPPRDEPTWEAMIRAGERPTRLHNNCSGKHAGFLTLARHWGIATEGYERIDHPVQQAVAATLSELSGVNDLPWGVDGCAAPNFALPLAAFARALAKLADPSALASPRKEAASRIVHAMMAHPELVSGTGRACAILMHACKGVAVKTGAEGFYAAMIPSARSRHCAQDR